ncbi:MAG: tetratricopeptide repeat protein [Actinomycetes bacterium]
MIRVLVVALVATTLALAGAVGVARQSPDDAPATIGSVPSTLPAGADVSGLVSSLQDRLRAVPADDTAWSALALAYVEQARVNGDGSLYARAGRAVRRALALRPEDNPPALAAGAALAAARHDFDDALRQADRALTLNPYQPVALAIRVDALTELGRYGDQLDAVRQADRRQPGVPVAIRYAYALELRGDLAGAVAVLRRSVSSTGLGERAHLLTLVADLERRRGRLTQARDALAEARALAPGYVPALVSSARLATATGRPEVATRRWEAAVAALPLPEYLVELGELHLSQGRPSQARAQFAVVEAATRLLADGGVNTDLETALFEADHGSVGAALAGARAEWQRRRSVHVADALGWALFRAGRPEQALPLLRRATRLGTAEPRFWLHRGTVEAALGLDRPARRHLAAGLAMDAGQSPWQAARATAVLEDLEEAR